MKLTGNAIFPGLLALEPLDRFSKKIAQLITSDTPPHMYTLDPSAQRGCQHMCEIVIVGRLYFRFTSFMLFFCIVCVYCVFCVIFLFLQYFDTVGWSFVKLPQITYTVLVRRLTLFAHLTRYRSACWTDNCH